MRGLHDFAVGEVHVEGVLVARDLADLRAVADVHAALLQALAPRAEHLLAAAGAELEVAAQIQEAWLRHDVLTLLVALDRLGVGVETFEQHVAGRAALGTTVALRRASGSAQPGGTRADDSDLVHAGTPAPARYSFLEYCQIVGGRCYRGGRRRARSLKVRRVTEKVTKSDLVIAQPAGISPWKPRGAFR